MLHRLTAAVAVAVVVAAIGFVIAPRPASAAPNNYADPATWLCRPGRADACSGDLTATVIAPDGALSKVSYQADPNAPVDCFYVYPTVSQEPTANSDMRAGPEEMRVAKMQFARFGAKCRLYAPLYRQVTMAALTGAAKGADTTLAYDDVRDAWNSYLAHDNHGRGVVLIGHSQGSGILVRLTAREIDGKPVQRRLVSAILTGTEIAVPTGAVQGGRFKQVPLCERADESGCVIGYSSYLASSPPGADSRFGADPGPGETDACVDPAQLLGRRALAAEFPAVGRVGDALGTTFVENPGAVTAQCARTGDRDYLAISIDAGAGVLQAELERLQARRPQWGLHPLDVNLALGDLVALVGRQSAAWSASALSPRR